MILIVDDKPENLFSLKTILEKNAFKVDTASSGEEALKKVLRNTYALIILDVQMPDMDGFEVAEALAGFNKTKNTPIIFLSAVSTHKKFITRGFESGAIDYIIKPVDPDILILRVHTFSRLFEQTTALNEAHQRLENANKELHLTLNSIPEVAFTAKPDGELDFVNSNWFKFSASETTFPHVPEGEMPLLYVWKETVAKGVPVEREVKIKDLLTGNFVHHLLRVTPVKEFNRIIKWTGVFVDIQQQKVSNELLEEKVEERTRALVEMNKRLEMSNSDLQQFASVASHDLKEPLRKIHLFSSLIKESLQGDEKVVGYFDKIMHASERMSRLVNDVLSYSKLSEADAFEQTDLNKVLKEVLDDLEYAIKEKKAIIHTTALPLIDTIPGLMRQVFQNIISNAIKFSKADTEPLIHIRSEVADGAALGIPAPDKVKYCRITISDNGIGFDEKYAQKIFSLFQRLHTRDHYEGTGIGLSIAKKIIEKHNGFIAAHGTPGKGADFVFVLPLHQRQYKSS